jgi:hypothetical protein
MIGATTTYNAIRGMQWTETGGFRPISDTTYQTMPKPLTYSEACQGK